MCGIVAAVAQRDVAPILIAGLKALEYRGYDSAGMAVLDQAATPAPAYDALHPHPGRSDAPFRIYNIGGDRPVELLHFIELLEQSLGRRVQKNLLPMQPGDVEATWADVSALRAATGWQPRVGIEDGIARFVAWYRDYYGQ